MENSLGVVKGLLLKETREGIYIYSEPIIARCHHKIPFSLELKIEQMGLPWWCSG